MKYLLTILLVLIPFICFGQGINPVGGCTRAYASCELLSSPIQNADNASAALGFTTAETHYLAIKFTMGQDATIRTVVLKMAADTNSPSENVVVALCTSGETDPTETCTNADSAMSSPGTEGYKYLRWASGYAVSNGSSYFIRIYTAQYDGSNYYNLRYQNDVASNSVKKSVDLSTWADYGGDSSARGFFELSECVTYTH